MSRRGFIGQASIEEIKYLIDKIREVRSNIINKELPTYNQENVDRFYIKLKAIKQEATKKLNSPTVSQAEKYDLEELLKDADELTSSIEGYVSNEYIELGRGPIETGGKKRRIRRRQRRTNKRRSNKRRTNKRRTGKRR